eukprot:15012861-Ditylum_brightwellii.AAC.1
MKVIAAERQSAPSISLFGDEITKLILACIYQICLQRKDLMLMVAFTAGVDATALVPAYQVSTSEHVILGRTAPNNFISVKDFTKNQILQLLTECQAGKHDSMATEVKVVVVSFQNTPSRMTPFLTLDGNPQTTNEQSQFELMVIESCSIAAMKDSNAILLNESKYGISCE